MAGFRSYLFLLLAIHIYTGVSVMWERLRCSLEATQAMPEGTVDDIGRFPWLGVVQHNFYIAGKVHFAITGAVLVHPAFAIASAEDISKINPNQLTNNTKLILWGSKKQKFAIDVKDYILHPEYHDKVTFATIALLDLIPWGEAQFNDWTAPVLPICMPVKGSGTLDNLYAVKMTDATGAMEKEIIKMIYVGNKDCEDFYYKAKLTYGKMNPVNPLCAVSEFSKQPCVWDGGTALISSQSWGFWKLIGFAVRGPGCGAPARFLNMHDYLPWINDVISSIPYEDSEDTYKIGIRRVSPIELIMYKDDTGLPKSQGQCSRSSRGGVLYKESAEVATNNNFGQGFFYVVITQLAQFSCAEVSLDVTSRTNAAVWVEHSCHRDDWGVAAGQKRVERERMSCFKYYKSAAYIEFRFYFSYKAIIQVTLYGTEEKKRILLNPFKSTVHTTMWWPTPGRLKFWYFVPANLWWYNL